MISIVIPVYNAEKTIVNALKSIENQTDDSYEVVLVNDGSMDKSLEMINDFINSLSMLHREKYHVINTENHGVSLARNRGIKESRGEYILFIDADDEISNCSIELFNKVLCTGRFPAATWTMDFGKLLNKSFLATKKELTISDLIKLYMHKNKPIVFLNILYKKTILEENQIFFESQFKYGEDNLFFWKYLFYLNKTKESRFILIEEPLYYYYVNPLSAMHKGSARQIDAIKAVRKAAKLYSTTKYSSLFIEYLYPRTVLSVINNYAKTNTKDLYYKTIDAFYTKKVLKMLLRTGEWKLMAGAILINFLPELNYIIIQSMIRKKNV